MKNKLLALAGALCLSFALTTCGDLPIIIGGDDSPFAITWHAIPIGDAPTASILLAFSVPVDLSISNVTITNQSGAAAATGTLNPQAGGLFWFLPVEVSRSGDVNVSINRTGLRTGPVPVTVTAYGDPVPDVSWGPVALGSPATTSIQIMFSTALPALNASQITITSGTGSVTPGTTVTGSGTTWQLPVSNVSTGYVNVSINVPGMRPGPKPVEVFAAGAPTAPPAPPAPEIPGGLPPSPPPPPTGGTSPAEAVARFQQYMSRADFEAMFPRRVGAPGWLAEMPHGAFPDWQTIGDYYSYDNLLEAIRFMANLQIRHYHRRGFPQAWNSQTRVLDKTTGQWRVVYTGAEFNANWQWEWTYNPMVHREVADFGNFLNHANRNDRLRELAGFLANIAHETSGSWATAPGWPATGLQPPLGWGLFFNEEVGFRGSTNPNYVGASAEFPARPGQSYHGRGPIQLSWNMNYGLFSRIIFGDLRLLDNPNMVTDSGVIGWKSAIWFWMNAQPYRPSPHQVISGNWEITQQARNMGWSGSPGFGYTIMVINGGLEGGFTEADGRIARRVAYYRAIMQRLGGTIPSGERVNTQGMRVFW